MKPAVTDLLSSGPSALKVMKSDSIGATRLIRLRWRTVTAQMRMMGEISAVRAGIVLTSFLVIGASTACAEMDLGSDTCISVGPSNCEPVPDPNDVDAAPDPDDPWWCLPDGEPTFTPMSPPPRFVWYVVPILDSARPDPREALPGLTVRACLDSDGACEASNPDSQYIPIIPFPPPGQDPGVSGFLVPYLGTVATELHLVLTATGYMPTEYFFGGPLIGAPSPEFPAGETVQLPVPPPLAPAFMVEPGEMVTIPIVRGLPIPMVKLDLIAGFFRDIAQGETMDPNAGIVAFRMIDCNGVRADGVSLDMAGDLGDGFGFVISRNNVPTRSDPPDLAGPTVAGPAGGAGFANLPTRPFQPMGILSDQRRYGGSVAFRLRPGTITNGEIRPSGYSYGR